MTEQRLEPRLPEGLGYRARPLTPADAQGLVTLLEQTTQEPDSDSPTREEIARILERLGDRLRTDSLGVFSQAGDSIAGALVLLPPASGDDEVATLLGVVHPDHHEKGLGTALLEWMEDRVRTAREADGTLKSMRMSCDPKNLARVRLFEQHEFRPVRYRFTMQMQLTTPIKEPGMLSDLAIIPWTEQQSESARAAFNRAFEGHWGLPTIREDMWLQRFVGVPQFRPDLSWLVLSDYEVIGLCINWGPSMDAENALSKRGWIEAIGVVPEWRGRGAADLMMRRSLNSFLGEGLSYASLDVDTQNPTGALQLYEKHGFPPPNERLFSRSYLIRQI